MPGQPPGATPLDPDEAAALMPSSVTTQEQLNLWEAENILEAESWLATRARVDVLDERFIRALHARMFGRTWRWAGTFRTSGKNIGIAPELIAPAIRDLVLDVRARVAAKAVPAEEIARRMANWKAPDLAGQVRPGSVHDKYIRLVSTAHYGCVL